MTDLMTSRKPQVPHPTVLVLVTDQQSCDRLIYAGRQLADQNRCTLEVLNIARFGAEPDPQATDAKRGPFHPVNVLFTGIGRRRLCGIGRTGGPVEL